jgi:large subunit ribosomal protein L25
MEHKTLSAMDRKEHTKGYNRSLRKAGKIPAVMYGHAGTSSVSVDEREFGQKFKRITENTIINLSIDGNAHDVLVKDFQEDAITGRITHIDFFEIESDKVLRTNVPVHLVGNAIGVREGGVLELRLHEIIVECLPKDIPEHVEIDIVPLQIGDAIHIADLPGIAGVKVINTPDQIVVTVSHAKEEVFVAVAAAGAEGAEGDEAAEAGTEAKSEE